MQDTIELTLPVSGKTVIIRNYTTVGDDDKAEEVLYAGVELDQKTKFDGEGSIKFPLANIIASQKAYVPRLVKSIDGDTTDIARRIKELRSEDYAAIQEAVEKVVEEHSPKAKEAKNASSADTNKK